ncbi:MAG: hypothetical protein K8U57_10215 [Planctomycetes bacterium]|nr:hypothetical protein [Planctomycetota bacterium]
MKNVCDFLRELVNRSDPLVNGISGNFARPRDYAQWIESSIQVLTYAELTEYRDKVLSLHLELPAILDTIETISGILVSAIECLERGFVGKLKHALRAEMFGTFAEEARDLLKRGQTLAAAMLGRVAIEKWLRDVAEANGIADYETERVSKLNDLLKSSGKFTQPKWRQIQSHLDTGNAAAHGNSISSGKMKLSRC